MEKLRNSENNDGKGNPLGMSTRPQLIKKISEVVFRSYLKIIPEICFSINGVSYFRGQHEVKHLFYETGM